jgi:hypothetical protein
MENSIKEEERNQVIKLIQESLIGKIIDASSNFSPQFLADAILQKLDFNRTFEEKNVKNLDSAIKAFNKMIDDIDYDMDNELAQLGPEETLLKNFVRGQKTACEKLREKLNQKI